jgi:hypothetical protein
MISFYVSRFWYFNVIDTVSDKCRDGSEWFSNLFPMKKRMFLRVSIFVFLLPDICKYSQDLIVKKKAPINNSHMAESIGETDDLENCHRIKPVTATCCFSPGSNVL